MVRAPPGSGYLRHDASDETEMALSHPELTKDDALQISPPAFPDTYEPMLEYPGTMRPGRTPENSEILLLLHHCIARFLGRDLTTLCLLQCRTTTSPAST